MDPFVVHNVQVKIARVREVEIQLAKGKSPGPIDSRTIFDTITALTCEYERNADGFHQGHWIARAFNLCYCPIFRPEVKRSSWRLSCARKLMATYEWVLQRCKLTWC